MTCLHASLGRAWTFGWAGAKFESVPETRTLSGGHFSLLVGRDRVSLVRTCDSPTSPKSGEVAYESAKFAHKRPNSLQFAKHFPPKLAEPTLTSVDKSTEFDDPGHAEKVNFAGTWSISPATWPTSPNVGRRRASKTQAPLTTPRPTVCRGAPFPSRTRGH